MMRTARTAWLPWPAGHAGLAARPLVLPAAAAATAAPLHLLRHRTAAPPAPKKGGAPNSRIQFSCHSNVEEERTSLGYASSCTAL
eukprot:scaffold54598_cov20-Tisochrysis_lutea.AAC.1